MTQQHLNEVKRECFAEVVKFADELEAEGIEVFVSRGKYSIGLHVHPYCDDTVLPNCFSFRMKDYDTTFEAGQEFYKQFNRFKISCKTNN